jgi:hypothetical protein
VLLHENFVPDSEPSDLGFMIDEQLSHDRCERSDWITAPTVAKHGPVELVEPRHNKLVRCERSDRGSRHAMQGNNQFEDPVPLSFAK